MASAPVFPVLWFISRRKFKKVTAESQHAAGLHQASLAHSGADNDATKAKYTPIISQAAEVARLQASASTFTGDIEKTRAS